SPMRTCARGSPRSARRSSHASNRRQRRSPPTTRPRSRSGGRSSRRRTSRANDKTQGPELAQQRKSWPGQLRDCGDEMSQEKTTGYLPGDPRYGLSGESLRNYYRAKPAQWAIYCWDKPGAQTTRRALLPDQKSYVKNFGERVIGYGHFVSDDGRDT